MKRRHNRNYKIVDHNVESAKVVDWSLEQGWNCTREGHYWLAVRHFSEALRASYELGVLFAVKDIIVFLNEASAELYASDLSHVLDMGAISSDKELTL